MVETASREESASRAIGVFAGAGIGALAAVGLWALYDATLLSAHGVFPPRGWLAASAHGSAAAAVAAAAVGAVVSAAGWLGGFARFYDDPVEVTAAGTAAGTVLVAFGATLFVAAPLIRQQFASGTVRALAIGLSGPALAVLWAGAGYALYRPLERAVGGWLGRRLSLHFGWLLPCAPVALATVSVPVVAPEVFASLSWHSYLPCFVAGLGALPGALGGRRGVDVRVTVAVAAAAAGVVGTHVALPESESLRSAAGRGTSGTAYLASLIESDVESTPDSPHSGSTAAESAPGESASCFPEVDPPREDGVGEVGDGAPDVIFVVADSMRWDHTSLSDYEYETTPNLERHAASATVFEEAYSAASNSRQAYRGIFTGMYPSIVDAPESTKWGTSFSDEQVTLAEQLRSAGYQTIALSSRDTAFPEKYGALDGFERIDRTPIPIEERTGRSVSFKVDRIIAHLSDPSVDRPQFVWTHLMEPHQPYPNGPDPVRFDSGKYSDYDSAIRFVDGELNRLLNFARGPTRRNDTYVILTADHGQAFEEHGVKFHGKTTYQEEIHVPFAVWGPDVEAGRYETPVSHVDLVPTLLDLLGLAVSDAYCGRSLAPTLRAGRPPRPRPVYVESIPDETRDHFATAWIDGHEKLMVYPEIPSLEIYDLSKDPGEQRDLAPKRPTLRSRLLGKLRNFYEERAMDPSFYNLDELPRTSGE